MSISQSQISSLLSLAQQQAQQQQQPIMTTQGQAQQQGQQAQQVQKQQLQALKEEAMQIREKVRQEFQKQMEESETVQKYYTEMLQNKETLQQQIASLKGEIVKNETILDETELEILTNDRKTLYEVDATQNLEIWMWRLFTIYYILALYFVLAKTEYSIGFACFIFIYPLVVSWIVNKVVLVAKYLYNNLMFYLTGISSMLSQHSSSST